MDTAIRKREREQIMTTTGREEQVGENLACVGKSMSIDGETTVLIVISLDKIDRYKCRLSVTKDIEVIYDNGFVGLTRQSIMIKTS